MREKLLLLFFLLCSFKQELFSQKIAEANAAKAKVLKNQVDSLSTLLSDLEKRNAVFSEIRKVKIILEDKKEELNRLIKYSKDEVFENGYHLIKDAFYESIKEVGTSDAFKTTVKKISEKTVRFKGYYYNINLSLSENYPTSMGDFLIPSWRTLDTTYNKEIINLSFDDLFLLNSIEISENNALKTNDYSRLKDIYGSLEYSRKFKKVYSINNKKQKLVTVEGVLEEFTTGNYYFNYKGFRLKDWVIVSVE